MIFNRKIMINKNKNKKIKIYEYEFKPLFYYLFIK